MRRLETHLKLGNVANIAFPDLVLKKVLLVQEKDQRGLGEILVVENCAKELNRLAHAVLRRILDEDLVVLIEGGDKHDGIHRVKMGEPLLPEVPLAAHVVHLELDAVNVVALGPEPNGAGAGHEHLLLAGHKVRANDSVEVLHEAEVGVHEVYF